MSIQTKTALIDIAVSTTLSSMVEVGRAAIIGLELPALTSTQVFLQVATKDNGPFSRLLKADGSGDWVIAATTGQKAIFIDEMAPFVFVKVECGTAQAANRSFVFSFAKE